MYPLIIIYHNLWYLWIWFQINHQIVRDSDLFSSLMGLICSRRSRSIPVAPPIAAPLLPAAVIEQIQSFNRLPASTVRAHRRWRRSIRRIITLLRLRKIWASLGRYLNDQACGRIFDHLQRRNGQIRYRISGSAASRPWSRQAVKPSSEKGSIMGSWCWTSRRSS